MRNLLLLLLFVARAASAGTTVTLLHFSDYHSHARPFYSEDAPSQGGVARAIGYLRREHQRGALVFSGGDMINKGSPAWSDKYGCAEWPWFNGVVDAMAFGNHEPDYGFGTFVQCREQLRYPILSANTNGFQRYEVFTRHGIRFGVFALAGPDFKSLVRLPELHFDDPVAAAREMVRVLREEERVDVVVMIGHEHTFDDYALARAVPGIDLIFGSHSHEKHPLTKIDGTKTWFIAPFQYLTYISRVSMSFDGRRLTSVKGELVPVDARMKTDARIEKRVAEMERELERDPQYASLFEPVGTLAQPLSVDALAARTLEAVRNAVHADVALSTVSSFRQPLPSGTITQESLRAAMPYDNEIVTCELRGDALQKLLAAIDARKGTDSFCYIARPESIDPAKTYRVAATDYVARIAYKDSFPCEPQKSGLRVRTVTTATLFPARSARLRRDCLRPAC